MEVVMCGTDEINILFQCRIFSCIFCGKQSWQSEKKIFHHDGLPARDSYAFYDGFVYVHDISEILP